MNLPQFTIFMLAMIALLWLTGCAGYDHSYTVGYTRGDQSLSVGVALHPAGYSK